MRQNLDHASRKLRLTLAAGALVLGSALAGGSVQAAVIGPEVIGTPTGVDALIQPVQFRYGDRDYCWYPDGWHGPGWYWCGYGARVGFGWGGPIGWNGWRFDRDDFRFREHHDRDDFRFHDYDRDHHDRDHDRGRDHDRH